MKILLFILISFNAFSHTFYGINLGSDRHGESCQVVANSTNFFTNVSLRIEFDQIITLVIPNQIKKEFRYGDWGFKYDGYALVGIREKSLPLYSETQKVVIFFDDNIAEVNSFQYYRTQIKILNTTHFHLQCELQ